MQPELRSAAADGQGQQLLLGERNRAAQFRVIGVPRGIDRYDHVVAVVAAVEKYAGQSLVVVGGRSARGKCTELAESCRRGECAGAGQETAAVHVSAPLGIVRMS